MTAQSRARGFGRRLPPAPHLIGRSEVARILECDRNTVRRYVRIGILKPAITEDDGVSWFDLETVQKFAVHRKTWRASERFSGKSRALRIVKAEDAYNPRLRSRRDPLVERPKSPKPPAAPKLRAVPNASPSGKPPGDDVPRGIGPHTEIRDEWWNEDLSGAQAEPLATEPTEKPESPVPPAETALEVPESPPSARQEPSPPGLTQIDPEWWNDDFEPEK